MTSSQTSFLLSPPPSISSLIHLAVIRDTREKKLSDAERLNFYPASPFATVSWIVEGDLSMMDALDFTFKPSNNPPLPRLIFTGPINRACVSWSPRSVYVFSISLYPEECAQHLRINMQEYLNAIVSLNALPPSPLQEALLRISLTTTTDPLESLTNALMPFATASTVLTDNKKSVTNWIKKLALLKTTTLANSSPRQQQRRHKLLLGQSYRSLQRYARLEQAYTLNKIDTPQSYADLAQQAGYSDQAHMGREVKRISGLSPAVLYRYIQSHEAFWMYRLLQQHLGKL